MIIMKRIALALLVGLFVSMGVGACGDDDSATDAGDTDTGADSDSDSDSDSDGDSDTGTTYDGTLGGEIKSAKVEVDANGVSTGSTIAIDFRFLAEGGNVNKVKPSEFRVYLEGQTEPFFTMPADKIVDPAVTPFDGNLTQDVERFVTYQFDDSKQNDFDLHCDEKVKLEADILWGDDANVKTYTFDVSAGVTVKCITG
jgi:hypothetical protein